MVASSGTAKIDAKEWLQQVPVPAPNPLLLPLTLSHTSRDPLAHPLMSPPQVLQPLGGKGGGKPTKAQGSAGDTAKLGDVLDLATKFAQSKLQ